MNDDIKLKIQFRVLVIMIFTAAFSRIIPHIPNFSPLGAIGLFGAALKKMASILNSYCSDLGK